MLRNARSLTRLRSGRSLSTTTSPWQYDQPKPLRFEAPAPGFLEPKRVKHYEPGKRRNVHLFVAGSALLLGGGATVAYLVVNRALATRDVKNAYIHYKIWQEEWDDSATLIGSEVRFRPNADLKDPAELDKAPEKPGPYERRNVVRGFNPKAHPIQVPVGGGGGAAKH